MHILTGAPAQLILMQNVGYNKDTVWNQITDAFKNDFLVGCDTTGRSIYNIPVQHAYTVLSAHELKDASGRVVQRLYRVRNPWNTDNYNGPWSD